MSPKTGNSNKARLTPDCNWNDNYHACPSLRHLCQDPRTISPLVVSLAKSYGRPQSLNPDTRYLPLDAFL